MIDSENNILLLKLSGCEKIFESPNFFEYDINKNLVFFTNLHLQPFIFDLEKRFMIPEPVFKEEDFISEELDNLLARFDTRIVDHIKYKN